MKDKSIVISNADKKNWTTSTKNEEGFFHTLDQLKDSRISAVITKDAKAAQNNEDTDGD